MGNEGGSSPVGGTDNDSDAVDTAASEEPPAEHRETSTCATCWQAIPPDRVRCPHCATADGPWGDEPETWAYDRIVLAVVPAESAREASAAAAAGFARARQLVCGPDVSHGEVTLWAAFETTLPSELTDGWPDLHSVVRYRSEAGQALFEAAATRCEQPGPADPVMYAEDGATIADREAVRTLEAVVEDAAVQYWVVPGVVKRYALPDEPDAFGDPLYCDDCGAVTEHDRSDTTDRAERPRWVCRVCGTQRYGPD